MKKSNIFLLVGIAVIIAVIISSFGSFSTYETFASASKNQGSKYIVMGVLDTTKEMRYDPLSDANIFEFYATDKKDQTSRVLFKGSKPQDFEKSEQLVMTGYMENGIFHCEKIQMKCPSKYEDDQVVVADNATVAAKS